MVPRSGAGLCNVFLYVEEKRGFGCPHRKGDAMLCEAALEAYLIFAANSF